MVNLRQRLRSAQIISFGADRPWIVRLRANAAAVALTVVLSFLVAGRALDPNFTPYWWWQVGRTSATLLAVLALQRSIASQGGLAAATQIIAILATVSEILGNARDLYTLFAWWDKLVHAATSAMLAAGAFELVPVLSRHGRLVWARRRPMAFAVACTVLLGIIWECYEYIGSTVVHVGARIGDPWDTTLDLVADTGGALVAAWLLQRRTGRHDLPATGRLLHPPPGP